MKDRVSKSDMTKRHHFHEEEVSARDDLPGKVLSAPLDTLINQQAAEWWWTCRNPSVQSGRSRMPDATPACSLTGYSDNWSLHTDRYPHPIIGSGRREPIHKMDSGMFSSMDLHIQS